MSILCSRYTKRMHKILHSILHRLFCAVVMKYSFVRTKYKKQQQQQQGSCKLSHRRDLNLTLGLCGNASTLNLFFVKITDKVLLFCAKCHGNTVSECSEEMQARAADSQTSLCPPPHPHPQPGPPRGGQAEKFCCVMLPCFIITDCKLKVPSVFSTPHLPPH